MLAHKRIAGRFNGFAQEALVLFRRLAESQPEVYWRDLATLLNNYSGIQRAQGRLKEALASATEALEILRRTLGGGHPDVATALSNCAGINRTLGYYDEAEEQYPRGARNSGRNVGREPSGICGLASQLG